LLLVRKLNHDRLAGLNTQTREHFFMSNAVIKIKFFASLREHVGQADAEVAESLANTVIDVWNSATNNMSLPENTLMAVNMDYVDATYPVKAGDEVAFFPPVTGG
jgi:molybdopterin synthase sulfur carrier subunit